MSPVMFEAVLFLKSNRRLWSVTMVYDVMNAKKDAGEEEIDDNDIYYSE